MATATLSANQRGYALKQTAAECKERCLHQTSKWCSEMFHSMSELTATGDTQSGQHISIVGLQTHRIDGDLERKEARRLGLATSFFNNREFRRCANVFLPVGDTGEADMPPADATLENHSFKSLISRGISQKALFLALYGLFMAGEKQRIRQLGVPLAPSDTSTVVNRQMVYIKGVLKIWFQKTCVDPVLRTRRDGYLEYLYGMIFVRERNRDRAKSWLCQSVERNPWNWGAWLELSHLVDGKKEFDAIEPEQQPIFQHCMGKIFLLYCRHKLHDLSASFLQDLAVLQVDFPRSQFLSAQKALTLFRQGELKKANALYCQMKSDYPDSIDTAEQHSNLLYKMGKKRSARSLAEACESFDKNCPETYMVVRNYHSLEKRHADAVKCFRKAVVLNPSSSGAWSLLGFEYDQMQNYPAAVASWLRAVEVDPHDDRSLAALGHGYEELGDYHLAVQYYRRALKLNRASVTFWQIFADCYITMSQYPDAIKALQSARMLSAPYADETVCDSKKHLSLVRFGRIELLKQLAQLRRAVDDDAIAIKTLERCLQEYTEHLRRADTEQRARRELTKHIIPQVNRLLKKWTRVEGEADEEQTSEEGDQDGSGDDDWLPDDESSEDESE
ncbi:hypothetical protein GGR53DRAFT_531399 [Hypoxylon sp. FL1150]|nr:hypothetical protein GGR53DRAFT_531399 [Hypoxylon sp. FL1150]